MFPSFNTLNWKKLRLQNCYNTYRRRYKRRFNVCSFEGKHHSEESKLAIGKANSGEGHGNWKGGITPVRARIRQSSEYKKWRQLVIERDKKCIICGTKEKLEVHHIIPFSDFGNRHLRFEVRNGATLCKTHHFITRKKGFSELVVNILKR